MTISQEKSLASPELTREQLLADILVNMQQIAEAKKNADSAVGRLMTFEFLPLIGKVAWQKFSDGTIHVKVTQQQFPHALQGVEIDAGFILNTSNQTEGYIPRNKSQIMTITAPNTTDEKVSYNYSIVSRSDLGELQIHATSGPGLSDEDLAAYRLFTVDIVESYNPSLKS